VTVLRRIHEAPEPVAPLSVIMLLTRIFRYGTVIQDRPPQVRVLWEQVIPLDSEIPYESLATIAERLSREDFRNLLGQEGLVSVRTPQEASDDAIEPEIERKLQRFNDLSQFAAVRALHASIANSGESPRRLAGLVRGYANLSLLTYAHYSTMSKTFAARSLLYAQRLRVKYADSPHGVWSRAYALAMLGLPESALRGLAESQDLIAGVESPPWLKGIEAYCRGDISEMRLIAADDPYDPLSTVLLWRTAHYRTNVVARFRAIGNVLDELDCLRARSRPQQLSGAGERASR
jgi:hypothetical protein